MASVGGSGTGSFMRSIRIGAGVWGTFRFVSMAIYAICWVVALPVELALNRKMGRRYTGLLPVLAAYVMFTTILLFTLPRQQLFAPSRQANLSDFVPFFAMCVMSLALVRHRLAAWWRFRSHEQIHSFSQGIPFWLNLPPFVTKLLPKPKPKAEKPAPPQKPIDKSPSPLKAAEVFLVAFTDFLAAQFPPFMRQWLSGEIPTGSIAWIASTIVHPALLFCASIPIAFLNPTIGAYLAWAAFAIFLKARIQKALIVETVYDLFDARIEHEFTQALSNPQKLQGVERTGFIVPEIARSLGDIEPKSDIRGSLAPELAALMRDTPTRVEVRSAADGGSPKDNGVPTAGATP